MKRREIAYAVAHDGLRQQLADLLRSFWGRVTQPRSSADRLLRVLVACLGIFLGIESFAGAIARLIPPMVYWKDVIQMYLLSRAMLHGIDPFLPLPALAARLLGTTPGYDIAALFPHPTPYPPTLGFLAMPLALLDYPTAAVVWLGLELILLAVDVWLLGRVVGVQLSLFAVLTLAVSSIAWDPVIQDLSWGQLDLLLLALVIGMVLALRRGDQRLAGFLLGLTILVKPVFGPVFVLFVLTKRWRLLGTCVMTVFAAYFIVGCIVGFGRLTEYFTQSLPATASYYKSATGNMSLWTLGWRLFGGTNGVFDHAISVPPLVNIPELATATSVVVPAMVFVAVGLAARRSRSLEVAISVMVCVSIVVSPIAWRHYLVIAALPTVQAIYLLVQCRFPRRETVVALLLLAVLLPSGYWEEQLTLVPGANPGMTVPVLIMLIPTVALTVVCWLLLRLDSLSCSIDADCLSQARWL